MESTVSFLTRGFHYYGQPAKYYSYQGPSPRKKTRIDPGGKIRRDGPAALAASLPRMLFEKSIGDFTAFCDRMPVTSCRQIQRGEALRSYVVNDRFLMHYPGE